LDESSCGGLVVSDKLGVKGADTVMRILDKDREPRFADTDRPTPINMYIQGIALDITKRNYCADVETPRAGER
jgi:hypothetical protein